METVQQSLIITEDQIIAPLVEVLDKVTPSVNHSPEPVSQTLTKSLDELFPEQQYDEKNIQKAKEILGKTANELTPDELQDTVIEMQFLASSWLDDFERKIYKGLTLRELLHEKGGL